LKWPTGKQVERLAKKTKKKKVRKGQRIQITVRHKEKIKCKYKGEKNRAAGELRMNPKGKRFRVNAVDAYCGDSASRSTKKDSPPGKGQDGHG